MPEYLHKGQDHLDECQFNWDGRARRSRETLALALDSEEYISAQIWLNLTVTVTSKYQISGCTQLAAKVRGIRMNFLSQHLRRHIPWKFVSKFASNDALLRGSTPVPRCVYRHLPEQRNTVARQANVFPAHMWSLSALSMPVSSDRPSLWFTLSVITGLPILLWAYKVRSSTQLQDMH